jgi:hypothetical protein
VSLFHYVLVGPLPMCAVHRNTFSTLTGVDVLTEVIMKSAVFWKNELGNLNTTVLEDQSNFNIYFLIFRFLCGSCLLKESRRLVLPELIVILCHYLYIDPLGRSFTLGLVTERSYELLTSLVRDTDFIHLILRPLFLPIQIETLKNNVKRMPDAIPGCSFGAYYYPLVFPVIHLIWWNVTSTLRMPWQEWASFLYNFIPINWSISYSNILHSACNL